ncbi:MAG: site-specific integrase [Mycobacterium sp.]|nr:site-specific integrase [Mycobacterium sp.]MBV8294450.1 site-specific integrase [Mycobacterium sp.]
MGKRAAGQGTIYKRADGRWEARLTYTDQDTGQRKRVAVYGKTQKAALTELKKVRDRLDAGKPARDATVTVAAWLERWRTTTLAVSDRAPATRSLYDCLSRKHLEPATIGRMSLDRLRPHHIEALILALREAKLSDSTIRSIYTVLRLALDGAVRDGLLARNPAAQVGRPGVQRREAKYLPADTVTALLRAAEASRYYPALVLMAGTGIRRGEAAALAWDAVDLDAGTMRVTATMSRVDGELVTTEPKTERSRRTVPLSTTLVALLKKHRKTQLEERLHAGNQWRDTGLVFTTELGSAVDPRNLLRVVEVAAKATKVEGIGTHTLRHSAAVDWLESGVHIKAVSDLLGHSSIAITGDVYGHTSDDTARAAVDGLAGRLGL